MIFKISATSKQTQKVVNEIEVDLPTKADCDVYLPQATSSWGDPDLYVLSIESQYSTLAISPRQIRLALLSQGIAENTIDVAIESLESPAKEAAMIAWKHSTSFQRSAPLVESIGSIIGLTSAQMDQLWSSGKVL